MLTAPTPSEIKIPFYAKVALISIGAFAFFYVMFIGQQIIVPIIYATIIAILLNPFVNFLMKRKINKVVAISLAIVLVLLITAALIYIVSMQLTLFSDTYPQLKQKFTEVSDQILLWISQTFNIKMYKINAWIKETQSDAYKNMGGTIAKTLNALKSVLIIVVLLPVYLFMILYYKPLLLEFIRKLFKKEHHVGVFDVLFSSKKIIQSYLVGLIVEAAIVATLNSVGLLALGIDYAIILGITGALLNVIPYIGGIIAIALPMIIAFVTKTPASAALVLGLYLLIQFIDNHVIIPRIVASRVKLNALISVIVVLIGAALWGIPGMFLSIPLTAIAKVIFDHVESLKPWGYLLGNIVPTATKIKIGFIRKKNKT